MHGMQYRIRGAGKTIFREVGANFRAYLDAAIRHAAQRDDLVFIDGRGPGWPYKSDAWVELIAVHKDGKLQACTNHGAALLRTCGIEPDNEPVPITLPDASDRKLHEVFDNFRDAFDSATADVLLAANQAVKRPLSSLLPDTTCAHNSALTAAITAAITEASRHAEFARLSGEGNPNKGYEQLIGVLQAGIGDAAQMRNHAHDWDPDTLFCRICNADGNA